VVTASHTTTVDSTRQPGHPYVTETDLDDRRSVDRAPLGDRSGFTVDVQLQQRPIPGPV